MSEDQIDKLARFYRALLIKRGRHKGHEYSIGALMVECEIETFMEVLDTLGCKREVLNRSAEMSAKKEV